MVPAIAVKRADREALLDCQRRRPTVLGLADRAAREAVGAGGTHHQEIARSQRQPRRSSVGLARLVAALGSQQVVLARLVVLLRLIVFRGVRLVARARRRGDGRIDGQPLHAVGDHHAVRRGAGRRSCHWPEARW